MSDFAAKDENEISQIIHAIENSENDEEIENLLKKLSLNSIFIKNQNSNISSPIHIALSNAITQNENLLKSTIIENTDNILKMFNSLKDIKEELVRNRRGVEAILSQMLILKKKYIEPYEKLNRSITNKKNLDTALDLYEKIKILKENFTMLRLYYEKESMVKTIDSSNSMSIFSKLKKSISEFNSISEINFQEINILKEDLDWFQTNEEKIMNSYRNKFHEAIRQMDNTQISKFLEFFTTLSTNNLIHEVKTYSNKLLKDLMIEKFFKKIIQSNINNYNQLDMIGENIGKIRKEIRDFFLELEKWTKIMNNFGMVIRTDFDRTNFVVYDEIMEIEGLKGIYDLFTDKIKSSISQILDKIKLNSKFSNAHAYFVKDFVFFYFVIKLYSLNTFNTSNLDKEISSPLDELKSVFVNKFKSAASENFNRALSLVKSVEKNAEANGRFERENIVNVQIIDHFVKYIKVMSMSFIDLNEEFSNYQEEDEENKINNTHTIHSCIFKNDALLKELQESFSNLLAEKYFNLIFEKLDNVINILNSNINFSEKQAQQALTLQVQKFYFFYYILHKMNEVFISFLNSNIPYLISESLQSLIQEKMIHYMNLFYKAFLDRIMKDVKILLINKDFSNLKSLIDNINSLLKLFFDSSNYNNNKGYEKFVSKFMIYLYYFICTVAVLTINISDKSNLDYFDYIFNLFEEYTGIFFSFKNVKFLTQFNTELKNILGLNNDFNYYEHISKEKTHFKLQKLIYYLRLFSLNENKLVLYLKSQKINLEVLCKLIPLIFMKYSKLPFAEFSIKENTDNQIITSFEEVLFKSENK